MSAVLGDTYFAEWTVSGSEHACYFAGLTAHIRVIEVRSDFINLFAFLYNFVTFERAATSEGNQKVESHSGIGQYFQIVVGSGYSYDHVVVEEKQKHKWKEEAICYWFYSQRDPVEADHHLDGIYDHLWQLTGH